MPQALPGSRAHRNYIDAMKGFGIIFVVAGHYIEYYRSSIPQANALFECIYLFHMPLFCIASGLVAKFNLRKLVTMQLWLYLVAQAAFLWYRTRILLEEPPEDLVQAILLPRSHMWYLYALILWSLTVPLLRLFVRYLGVPGRFAAMALALAAGLAGGSVEWPFSLYRIVAFFPFFAFGVLFSDWVDAWQRIASSYLLVRLALWAVLIFSYGALFSHIASAPNQVYENARIFHDCAYSEGYTLFDRGAAYVIGFLTTMALAAVLGRFSTLASLGRRTLPVYLLHLPLLFTFYFIGCYQAVTDHGLVSIRIWLAFVIPAVICLCASRPAVLILDVISGLWYRVIPGLVGKAVRLLRAEKAA